MAQLVAGHVHQALREGGMQIALIWPTPWPDRWHVGLTTTLRWATRDAVPGDRVFDVLQALGLRPRPAQPVLPLALDWPATEDESAALAS